MKQANERPGPGGVIPGDVVYFKHPQHGPLSGRVHASGQHGCQIAHETAESGYHKVPWDAVLGHKKRHVRKLEIVEQGEDGSIAIDERGQRVFVHGAPGDEEEPEEDLSKAEEAAPGPILVDIGHVHEEGCNHALEGLYKALSDEDGAAFDIWQAHPNTFISALVEKFTERGLSKLSDVQADLGKWLAGEYHVPHKDIPALPAGAMPRWTQAELDLARIYLESIPADAMSFDDWSLVIDYLVQRYLPAEAINEEAEWLATKASLLGRAQAALGAVPALTAAAIEEALPGTAAEAVHMFSYSDLAESIMDYGRVRSCEAVTAFSETMRHRLKRSILDYQQQRLAGENVSLSSLQTQLFDQFDQLNRDWRRIAITEAGEMANQGVIAGLPRDSRVRRIEAYQGACPFCRKIDGRIFRVTTASDPDKDGYADVWPGKTNIGRSASPMKRVGNQLVARDAGERWWVAAGTQHPHCRGRWEPVEGVKAADPEFAAWLATRFGHKEGMAPDE